MSLCGQKSMSVIHSLTPQAGGLKPTPVMQATDAAVFKSTETFKIPN